VLILDDLPDGPLFDLWSIASRLPTRRLTEISSNDTEPTNIVVPLPGGSNPLWHGDWTNITCGQSELLKTFSKRVLDFYNIPVRPETFLWKLPLTITFIDRKQQRSLLNQTEHLSALQAAHPNTKIQTIDFAAMPLADQIRAVPSSDILVGVHGAGLTHGMFLQPHSTLVEILTLELEHRGFSNMEKFLGHQYYSRHGREFDSEEKTGDWHVDDVCIEGDEFMDLMEEAIGSAGTR
jgi:EGF domain-specific O-GlcNAc transferase